MGGPFSAPEFIVLLSLSFGFSLVALTAVFRNTAASEMHSDVIPRDVFYITLTVQSGRMVADN